MSIERQLSDVAELVRRLLSQPGAVVLVEARAASPRAGTLDAFLADVLAELRAQEVPS